MSGFLNPIKAQDDDDGVHRTLLEDITYHVGSLQSTDKIVIPAGFVTDGGSVPRPLWGIVSPWGKASKPYILHDWLYNTQERTRLVSDAILLEAMEVVGVNWFQRFLIYRGVRLGGWVAWNGHKRENQRRLENERQRVCEDGSGKGNGEKGN